MKLLSALIAGLIFGFGLAVSGMMDPAKVTGFLDLSGAWDPTLAFVMGGGLLINLPAYWLTRRKTQPLFETRFYLPTKHDLDRPLLIGAAFFGIGWGIAGLCPGPAIALLSQGHIESVLFCAALVVGMLSADRVSKLFA